MSIIGVQWEKISPGHTLFIFDNSKTWMSILISKKNSGIWNQILVSISKINHRMDQWKNKS